MDRLKIRGWRIDRIILFIFFMPIVAILFFLGLLGFGFCVICAGSYHHVKNNWGRLYEEETKS